MLSTRGRLRLYSARTLDPLVVLSHHRTSLQTVAFSPLTTSSTPFLVDEDEDSSDEENVEEEGRGQWLAAAGQEGKVSLWRVYPVKGK
jgi:hypothetical protein